MTTASSASICRCSCWRTSAPVAHVNRVPRPCIKANRLKSRFRPRSQPLKSVRSPTGLLQAQKTTPAAESIQPDSSHCGCCRLPPPGSEPRTTVLSTRLHYRSEEHAARPCKQASILTSALLRHRPPITLQGAVNACRRRHRPGRHAHAQAAWRTADRCPGLDRRRRHLRVR